MLVVGNNDEVMFIVVLVVNVIGNNLKCVNVKVRIWFIKNIKFWF